MEMPSSPAKCLPLLIRYWKWSLVYVPNSKLEAQGTEIADSGTNRRPPNKRITTRVKKHCLFCSQQHQKNDGPLRHVLSALSVRFISGNYVSGFHSFINNASRQSWHGATHPGSSLDETGWNLERT